MIDKIKRALQNIKHQELGLDTVKIQELTRLGRGESNLNFLANISGKKFVVRVNMNKREPNKARREFNALKAIEGLGIGPKAYVLDESKKIVDAEYLIVEYLEGKSLNMVKGYWNNEFIRKLARLVAKMHSIKITKKLEKLQKGWDSYQALIKNIEKMANYVVKKDQRLKPLITESIKNINTNGPKPKITLGHEDVCQQNVIMHKGNLKLIDFESFGLMDPAAEVSKIFEDFGHEFTKNERRIFLEEYGKIRKDSTIEKRIKFYIPGHFLEVSVWSIMHVYESQSEDFHEEFVNDKDVEEEKEYAKECFMKCITEKVIDKKWKNFKLFNQ
ncbi:aminoglycoside phosphotransferase family protein [Candidatus Woesearchaeota archaeon]|nr:aminoglycoside phosphotransferase family protein [Candidatus Woesearchaeota archaeon]